MKNYHNYLFLFGFLYYLICPIIIGENGYLSEHLGMHLFYADYPNDIQIMQYYLLCFTFFVSFYLGSFSALLFRKKSINKIESNITPKLEINDWILFLAILINQYIILSNSAVLFAGYTFGYQVEVLGKIASFNCFYLFLYLYSKLTVTNEKLSLVLTILIIENSIMLLGLGCRMFVLIPLVGYIIYILDNNKMKLKKIIILFVLFVVFFLVIGVIRKGDTNIDYETLIYLGLAEPVYTWISVGSFIAYNPSIHMIDYPANFIGTFLNFIPTFLFPNKADFIAEIPYIYNTPLGASNIIVNLYGNFGLLITPFIVYIGGFLLSVIRYNKTIFCQTYYYCCCGLLPFILFRDMQSVNKLLFTSFLIYPLAILFKMKITKRT